MNLNRKIPVNKSSVVSLFLNGQPRKKFFADKEREGWMVGRHERAACLKPAPVANMGERIEREIACLELA
jgi:hypothetical protein